MCIDLQHCNITAEFMLHEIEFCTVRFKHYPWKPFCLRIFSKRTNTLYYFSCATKLIYVCVSDGSLMRNNNLGCLYLHLCWRQTPQDVNWHICLFQLHRVWLSDPIYTKNVRTCPSLRLKNISITLSRNSGSAAWLADLATNFHASSQNEKFLPKYLLDSKSD